VAPGRLGKSEGGYLTLLGGEGTVGNQLRRREGLGAQTHSKGGMEMLKKEVFWLKLLGEVLEKGRVGGFTNRKFVGGRVFCSRYKKKA